MMRQCPEKIDDSWEGRLGVSIRIVALGAIFFSCREEEIHHRAHSAARWPQPKLAMIADCRLPIGD